MHRPIQICRVHVVVPVRNEELLLGACLQSIDAAAAALRRERPDVVTSVCVVLDSCTDRSESVVRRFGGVQVLSIDAASVGAARLHGVAHVDAVTSARERSSTWVANTDADTVVPAHWLTAQVALAETGIQLVIGTVEPDAADLDPAVLADWWVRHELGESHEHVHGANLGFTLAAYLSVGGYAPLNEHEDVSLVAALRGSGVPWRATSATHVHTSGRDTGRTAGGFARYLRELALQSNLGGVAAVET